MELYIHIPFCVRKCRYCDFLSFASDACVREKYVDQLIREIESIPEEDAGQCPENAALRLNLTGRTVETIFIGGGTPSLLPPSAIERILAAVRQVFRVEPDAEITMEANPGTLTPDSAAGYRNAGVSRLSLGLQSASEEELRPHSTHQNPGSSQSAHPALPRSSPPSSAPDTRRAPAPSPLPSPASEPS